MAIGLKSFKNMKIGRLEGQMARELARKVYACTEWGDFSRAFGLKDQIRRAAGSVMHNIAEGFDAGSDVEFTRFFTMLNVPVQKFKVSSMFL